MSGHACITRYSRLNLDEVSYESGILQARMVIAKQKLKRCQEEMRQCWLDVLRPRPTKKSKS